MNHTKTKCLTVSRSRTAFPPHPYLFIDDTPLTVSDSFKIFGVPVIFDSKFTFEHLCSVSSSVAQKIDLLRKTFKVLGHQSVLQKSFNSFFKNT